MLRRDGCSRTVIENPEVVTVLFKIDGRLVQVEAAALRRGFRDGLAAPAEVFSKPRIVITPPRGSISGDWKAVGRDMRAAMAKATAN